MGQGQLGFIMYALSQQEDWYGLVERMDSMATHGARIWDTSLGKQLMQLVPEGTTRVVVDISLDDVVKIYYEVNHSEPILNLDWAKAFDSATLVKLEKTGVLGERIKRQGEALNDSNELAGIPDKSKAAAAPGNGADPFVSVADHSNPPEYYTVRRELWRLLGENK